MVKDCEKVPREEKTQSTTICINESDKSDAVLLRCSLCGLCNVTHWQQDVESSSTLHQLHVYNLMESRLQPVPVAIAT